MVQGMANQKYHGMNGGRILLTTQVQSANIANVQGKLMKKKRRGVGKGPAMERHICKLLSEWWSPGRDDIFWRTAGSGGRSTIRGRKGKKTVNQAGDICATDPIGQPFLDCFAVEIKRGYPTATIHDLLDTKKPIYAKWIDQARASRDASGAEWWMIIHQRDRRETLVVMPSAWNVLPDVYPDCRLINVEMGKGIEIDVISLSNFLKLISPNDCRSYAEKRKQQ